MSTLLSEAAVAQLSTQQGTQRSDPPYTYGAPDQQPNLAVIPEFRFSVGGRVLDSVESCTWDDVNAILRGELTTRDVLYDVTPAPTVSEGTMVQCDVNEGAGYGYLWEMRAAKPALTASSRQRTFQLVNDLDLLARSEMEPPVYRKNAKHPGGWTGDQIIRDVCDRFHVPVGQLYKGTRKMQKSWSNAVSPLEVIRYVVRRERQLTGRKLVLTWYRGKLNVTPLTRSPHLLGLGKTLIEAAFSSELPEEFASAIIIHGLPEQQQPPPVDSKGRKKRKPQKGWVLVESGSSIARFGYVRKIVYSPDAKNDSQLMEEAKSYLAAAAKPLKHLTLTHSGMPRIKRGDAIKLALGDDALRNQIVYVYGVHHTLLPSGYQVQVSVIFDDPYIDDHSRSILWKLKQTADEAAAASPAAGQGNPGKNDTAPPTIFDPGSATPGANAPAGGEHGFQP